MNNFYPNNNFIGTMYNQNVPVAKMTQTLTAEDIKKLRNTSSEFSLRVEPLEILRSKCTHKDNGKIALQDNNDGTVTCLICGRKFKLLDINAEQVRELTETYLDVLESIKTYFLDIPEAYVNEFFPIIPMIEKVPKLYDLALNNFKRYEGANTLQNQNSNFGLNMYYSLFGGAPGAAANWQQQAPQQQYAQQPQPGYNYYDPNAGGQNPFGGNGFNQPNPGQAPAGSNPNEITTTKSFNL